MKHKIGIIGAGFVGSACEIGFSNRSNTQVLVYDKYKPTDSLHTVVFRSNVLFVCLPTPMLEDGSCDPSIVAEGVRQIAACSRSRKTIVIKSTVPPGTTEALQAQHPQHQLYFNPEFLTQNNFIDDFVNQKLILLGIPSKVNDKKCYLLVDSLYADFTAYQKNPATILWVDSKTAEMFKYTVNTFLATKVSFFNEIHQICAASGIRYDCVRNLLDRDERIGLTHTHVPGADGQFGWGGSCFPKDINALIAFARKVGVDPLMLDSAWSKNLLMRDKYDWEELAQVTGDYAGASA